MEDVGQDVEVGRVPDEDVPPAVELGQRSQHSRREGTEPLQGGAELVVHDPEDES